MEIEDAITKLITRNRNFVEKHGVSDYSTMSDDIINAILNLYHSHRALKEKLKHLEKIFTIYDIDEKDYELPNIYLDFISEHKYQISSPLMMEYLITRFQRIDRAITDYYNDMLSLQNLIDTCSNDEIVAYAKNELVKNELYDYRNEQLETILNIFRPKYLMLISNELKIYGNTYAY